MLRTISLNLCKKLVFLLLSQPHLAIGTAIATIEATLEAEKRFPDSHLGHGYANAYKHAAWNALLAYYTQWSFKHPEQALALAKTVTDLHEACFPNKRSEKEMDLANNLIGRTVYMQLYQHNQNKPHKKVLLDELERQDFRVLD